MDGWIFFSFSFNFNFLWTFLIIHFTYFPMVCSFRGGGCKDPLQPHAYLVIMFTFVYIVFFLLPTTIHMNVPYYLTIEKGLVHFGSEVRKISYKEPNWTPPVFPIIEDDDDDELGINI